MNKDLLAPKEITSKELKELVDEWVANGGVIKQCAPGVALNFRSQLADASKPARLKRPADKKGKSTRKKKK